MAVDRPVARPRLPATREDGPADATLGDASSGCPILALRPSPMAPLDSSTKVRKSISDSEHGQQIARIMRVGFDLPPQILDVGVDGALV